MKYLTSNIPLSDCLSALQNAGVRGRKREE